MAIEQAKRDQSADSTSTSIGGLGAMRARCFLWIATISGVGRIVVTRVEPSLKVSGHWRGPWKAQVTRGDPAAFRYLRGGEFDGAGLRHLVAKLVMGGGAKKQRLAQGAHAAKQGKKITGCSDGFGSSPSPMFMNSGEGRLGSTPSVHLLSASRSSTSIASRPVAAGHRCAYFSVIFTSAWPSSLETLSSETPAWTSQEAKVSRKAGAITYLFE